jgi:SAM-dependent methyltransferase
MSRTRIGALLVGVGVGAAVAVHLGRHVMTGHGATGGLVMGDAAGYDLMSRLLLGSFFDGIAADVAKVAPDGGRVLEIGCGPGHLSVRLVRSGLVVTGLDLDEGMIERARLSADRIAPGPERPTFVVGDVAALPFADSSFDVIVSTLSMHHWSDPQAGLEEIARVLRPGAKALIWDFPSDRPHPFAPRHERVANPFANGGAGPLTTVSAVPWRWPFRFSIVRRVELARPA